MAKGKGMAIAGMVLGILSLVAGFWFWFVGVPMGIVGLVLSAVGGKKLKAAGQPRGMAIAGLVLSIVSLASTVLVTVCGVLALGALGSL